MGAPGRGGLSSGWGLRARVDNLSTRGGSARACVGATSRAWRFWNPGIPRPRARGSYSGYSSRSGIVEGPESTPGPSCVTIELSGNDGGENGRR